MKAMTKAELAKAAGVSFRTLSPQIGVKYILETFCIDV